MRPWSCPASALPFPPPKPRSNRGTGARRRLPPGTSQHTGSNVSAQKSNVTPRVTAGPKRYRPGTLFRGGDTVTGVTLPCSTYWPSVAATRDGGAGTVRTHARVGPPRRYFRQNKYIITRLEGPVRPSRIGLAAADGPRVRVRDRVRRRLVAVAQGPKPPSAVDHGGRRSCHTAHPNDRAYPPVGASGEPARARRPRSSLRI